MAASKPTKPGDGSRAKHGTDIPKGGAFLPGANTDVLRKVHRKLSGRKNVSKAVHILAAAIKWREWLGAGGMSRQLMSAPLHHT